MGFGVIAKALRAAFVQVKGDAVYELPASADEVRAALVADIDTVRADAFERVEQEVAKGDEAFHRAGVIRKGEYQRIVHELRIDDAKFLFQIMRVKAVGKFAEGLRIVQPCRHGKALVSRALGKGRGEAPERAVCDARGNAHAVFSGKLSESRSYHNYHPCEIFSPCLI